uniref:Uncharacterized protein n=1 Tax=Rhizophora mucronata TaxID=61149 RepID=A0A2P2M713_RHIMU
MILVVLLTLVLECLAFFQSLVRLLLVLLLLPLVVKMATTQAITTNRLQQQNLWSREPRPGDAGSSKFGKRRGSANTIYSTTILPGPSAPTTPLFLYIYL